MAFSYYHTKVEEMVEAALIAWAWTNLENAENADAVGELLFLDGDHVATAIVNHRGYVYNIEVKDERNNKK